MNGVRQFGHRDRSVWALLTGNTSVVRRFDQDVSGDWLQLESLTPDQKIQKMAVWDFLARQYLRQCQLTRNSNARPASKHRK
jgi:hypothetical protein